MNKTTKTRHHCYNETNNVKVIKLQKSPDQPLTRLLGHSEWLPGTGPHTEIAKANIKNALTGALKGVPKSAEQKLKMRLAKLGKPKTEEHKANMSASHKLRLANKKAENEQRRNDIKQID